MIPKKALEEFAEKYGGQTQAVFVMAQTVAALKAEADFCNFDFNDVCDLADALVVRAKAGKRKAAPLLEAMGFNENDGYALP